MKKLLFLLPLTIMFISCAGPSQHQLLITPSFVPVTQSVAKLSDNNKASKTHAEKARQAIDAAEKADSPQTLKLALEAAKDQVDALTQILLDDADAIQKLENQLKAVGAEAQKQTDIANTVLVENSNLSRKNVLLAAQAKIDRDHVHKLKFWICGAGAAIGLFAVFEFGSGLLALLGPWGMLAYVIVPGAIYAFLWRWL